MRLPIEISASDADRTERWQVGPIAVEGGLKIRLLGLTIGRIDLRLLVTSGGRDVQVLRPEATHDADELLTLPRAHLYRLARDAEVSGRSTMSRDELIEALRR